MPGSRWKWLVGRSPLTDLRALGSSLLVHGLLLTLASLMALSAVVPLAPELPPALSGEIDPVDNRATQEGGGGPGELGGQGLVEALPSKPADSDTPGLATRDPSADALLSEILPATPTPDAAQRALPGPQITGLGNLPGPGLGGGGGSGGGSGGGVGRGIGPGTEFFGAREHASSFAYVIDCSGSMASWKALEVAKRELLVSLNQLPPDALFGIIFYNLRAFDPLDPQGNPHLLAATTAHKDLVRRQLARVAPDGGTDHMLALRAALTLHTEVIFFLTDADLMSNSDVSEVLRLAGNTRIQCIEFGRGIDIGGSPPLRRLASASGGTYRYIDVTRFSPALR
jgi:hypothetical protein